MQSSWVCWHPDACVKLWLKWKSQAVALIDWLHTRWSHLFASCTLCICKSPISDILVDRANTRFHHSLQRRESLVRWCCRRDTLQDSCMHRRPSSSMSLSSSQAWAQYWPHHNRRPLGNTAGRLNLFSQACRNPTRMLHTWAQLSIARLSGTFKTKFADWTGL